MGKITIPSNNNSLLNYHLSLDSYVLLLSLLHQKIVIFSLGVSEGRIIERFISLIMFFLCKYFFYSMFVTA